MPRDQVHARQVEPHRPPEGLPPSDPDALREAIDEAAALLTAARRPMILADVEIHRFGLQDELLALAESTGMPIATTILGKSVISEAHPLFAGVYEGAMGRPEVTELVESADCLLDARLLPDRHQPGDLHGQARPVEVHRRDQRGPPDPASPLSRRPARRLHPRADRAAGSKWSGPRCPKRSNPFAGSGRARPDDAARPRAASSAGSTGCSPSTPT